MFQLFLWWWLSQLSVPILCSLASLCKKTRSEVENSGQPQILEKDFPFPVSIKYTYSAVSQTGNEYPLLILKVFFLDIFATQHFATHHHWIGYPTIDLFVFASIYQLLLCWSLCTTSVYIFCPRMCTNKNLIPFLGQGVSVQLHFHQQEWLYSDIAPWSSTGTITENQVANAPSGSVFSMMGTEFESRRLFLLMDPHRNIHGGIRSPLYTERDQRWAELRGRWRSAPPPQSHALT